MFNKLRERKGGGRVCASANIGTEQCVYIVPSLGVSQYAVRVCLRLICQKFDAIFSAGKEKVLWLSFGLLSNCHLQPNCKFLQDWLNWILPNDDYTIYLIYLRLCKIVKSAKIFAAELAELIVDNNNYITIVEKAMKKLEHCSMQACNRLMSWAVKDHPYVCFLPTRLPIQLRRMSRAGRLGFAVNPLVSGVKKIKFRKLALTDFYWLHW